MPEMREREIHQREQQSKTMTDLETRMRAAGAPQPATNLEGGWRSADDFPETSETVVGAMKDGTWGLVWFEHDMGCWDSTEDILCADVAMWKAIGPHPLATIAEGLECPCNHDAQKRDGWKGCMNCGEDFYPAQPDASSPFVPESELIQPAICVCPSCRKRGEVCALTRDTSLCSRCAKPTQYFLATAQPEAKEQHGCGAILFHDDDDWRCGRGGPTVLLCDKCDPVGGVRFKHSTPVLGDGETLEQQPPS